MLLFNDLVIVKYSELQILLSSYLSYLYSCLNLWVSTSEKYIY